MTRHDYFENENVRLHYAHTGEGPLIVFLHGFPQCWYTFRHQLAAFGADHLAVAPDLRGYNLSGKPHGVHEYGPWAGARDVKALAEHLGYERLVLVGHDWGCAIAWSFALLHPEMLDALVILATGHPAVFHEALSNDPEQIEASQYLLALRQAETSGLLRDADFEPLADAIDFPFFTEEDRAVYRESWQQPGAAEGMMAWYRAEGLGPAADGTPARGNFAPQVTPLVVEVPTLVIYPDADVYTRPASHAGLADYVPDLTFKTIEGGSHWVAEEHPDTVNGWIRDFLAERQSTTSPAAAAQGASA